MFEQTFQAEHFINRELSWLEFNARVLEEAEDPTQSAAWSGSSSCRSSARTWTSSSWSAWPGLREQAFGDGAPQDFAPDGLRPIAQLQRIAQRTQELVAAQYRCWNESVLPQLAAAGVTLLKHSELDPRAAETLDRFFRERAFPILTPMAVDPGPSQPALSQPRLVSGRDARAAPRAWARSSCSRSCRCRKCCRGWCRWGREIVSSSSCWKRRSSARLPELFGGFDVLSWTTFRITRDSDIELLEQESDDMLRLIEDRLKARQRGEAVRLEVAAGGSDELLRMIIDEESIARRRAGRL